MVECGPKTYYSVCYLWLICVVTGAIIFDDLSIVFGLTSGCYETMMDYIFPGLFFLSAVSFGDLRRPFGKILAYIFVAIGVGFAIFANYYNISKIIRG